MSATGVVENRKIWKMFGRKSKRVGGGLDARKRRRDSGSSLGSFSGQVGDGMYLMKMRRSKGPASINEGWTS